MNSPGKIRRIVGLVVHGLIGALLIFAGSGKVFGFAPPQVVEGMTKYGLRDRLTLIGTGEMISALLLLLPVTSSLGVLLVSAFWGGVICIHMAHGESYTTGAVMLVLTWVGAFLRNPEMFASFTRSAPKAAAVEPLPENSS